MDLKVVPLHPLKKALVFKTMCKRRYSLWPLVLIAPSQFLTSKWLQLCFFLDLGQGHLAVWTLSSTRNPLHPSTHKRALVFKTTAAIHDVYGRQLEILWHGVFHPVTTKSFIGSHYSSLVWYTTHPLLAQETMTGNVLRPVTTNRFLKEPQIWLLESCNFPFSWISQVLKASCKKE
jgi:hypothetical protein